MASLGATAYAFISITETLQRFSRNRELKRYGNKISRKKDKYITFEEIKIYSNRKVKVYKSKMRPKMNIVNHAKELLSRKLVLF